MSKWVQHISGQGEKHEVVEVWDKTWDVMAEGCRLILPKSEYRLCDPPEVWKDVTEKIVIVERAEFSELVCDGEIVNIKHGRYRLRKVPFCGGEGIHEPERRWAFIVERKEPS